MHNEKKQAFKNKYNQAIGIIGVIVAMLGIYMVVYNSICYVKTPNITGTMLPDAIGVIEDAGVIEDDDYIYQINITDSQTGEKLKTDNLTADDYLEYQKDRVVDQIPKPNTKLKIHDSILYKYRKYQVTDLLTLYVEKENNDEE